MAETASPPVPRVLVVDDSAAMRALVRSLLEPAHEVAAVGSGEEALALAPTFAPDLIVSDLLLPGMSGAELCQRVRQADGLADVPFILLTTLSDATSRALGLEAGADDYLAKPLRERELRARVVSLLRLRRAAQALSARTRQLESANAALRDTQAQLVRAGKLASVGMLAAGLAHELNNPLSVLTSGTGALVEAVEEIGRLAVARGEAATPALRQALDDARELCAELDAGSRRLARVARGLGGIATPAEPAEELVDPAEVVESTLLMARSAFPEMPAVEVEREPGPPVESVGRLLTQGLYPLVENAVQAAGPGGRVRIQVRQLNVGVEIVIQDSGPGIPAALLPRVFDPFVTTRPAGQGSGLGLSVAAGILHGLGGDIQAESPPGEGARFSVRLPRRGASRGGAPVRGGTTP
jgi:signal transduction histidine kinase